MSNSKRWLVLSYDSTAKAYKRSNIKEDIIEFLLLLNVGTKNFNIREIESYSDSTIHFAINTNSPINDYKTILKEILNNNNLKIVAYSIGLISIVKDTNEQLYEYLPKQPLKNDFDNLVAKVKADNKIK